MCHSFTDEDGTADGQIHLDVSSSAVKGTEGKEIWVVDVGMKYILS